MVPDVPPKQFALYNICNTPITDTMTSDSSSSSPLTEVAQLLQEGAVLDPPEAFGIPLHGAVSAGQLSIVQYLLEHGASVNRFTRTGQTALQLAVLGNYPDIIQLLLQYGANIFCSLSPPTQNLMTNSDNNYSSSYLVNRHHRNVITNFDPNSDGGVHERTLLHFIAMQDTSINGKSVELICSSWCQALSLLIGITSSSNNNANINNHATSTSSSTSSSSAITNNPSIKAPLCGVDPVDEDNCTPLLYAAVHANIGAVKVLLKYGANPGKVELVNSTTPNNPVSTVNSKSPKSPSMSSTPVVPVIPRASPLIATLEPTFIASLATVAALIDNSDPTEAYNELQEYLQIIQLLLEAGGELSNECNVDPEDIEWKFPAFPRLPVPPSPSSTASSATSPTSSKLLFTPFSALCSQILLAPILTYILQKVPHPCNPNVVNSDSSSPLLIAISAGNIKVVKELIKYGMLPATHTNSTPTWETGLVGEAYRRAVSLLAPPVPDGGDIPIPNIDGLVTETVLAELKQILKI